MRHLTCCCLAGAKSKRSCIRSSATLQFGCAVTFLHRVENNGESNSARRGTTGTILDATKADETMSYLVEIDGAGEEVVAAGKDMVLADEFQHQSDGKEELEWDSDDEFEDEMDAVAGFCGDGGAVVLTCSWLKSGDTTDEVVGNTDISCTHTGVIAPRSLYVRRFVFTGQRTRRLTSGITAPSRALSQTRSNITFCTTTVTWKIWTC